MIRMFVLVLFFAVIAAPHNSEADMMGKPNIEIFFDDSIPADLKVELLTCQTSTCERMGIFREMGPQYFDCTSPERKESHSCYAQAYGFPPFLKLRLKIKDAAYESEPFEPGGDLNAVLKGGKLVLSKHRWWWPW